MVILARWLTVIFTASLVASVASADYLVVRRNAYLKVAPEGDATRRRQLAIDEELSLVSEQQQNGYYVARTVNDNLEGFVYRTLVRRYPGQPPSAIAGPLAPAPVIDPAVDVAIPGPLLASRTDSDLYMRVVDVGPGLCVLGLAPGGRQFVYDGGHWHGRQCIERAAALFDAPEIEILMISHSDGDHLGDADDILDSFDTEIILRSGFDRSDTQGWSNFDEAVGREAASGATVFNLETWDIEPGVVFPIGTQVTLTFVAGWHVWTPQPGEPTLSRSELRNIISLVGKVDFGSRSVLLTGDTVGRHIGDPTDTCSFAERVIVERHNGQGPSLTADVIVAPHHGADNGSSTCFVEAVDPDFVVFSAGHEYGHPRAAAAQRYLDAGVLMANIYRTDRGDDEEDEPREWKEGSIDGCQDRRGDDDVEILITQAGNVSVGYAQPDGGCN